MHVLNRTIFASSALALVAAAPALAADCGERLEALEPKAAAVELSAENKREVEARFDEARMLKAEGAEQACLTVARGIEDMLTAEDGSAAATGTGAGAGATVGADAGAGATVGTEARTDSEARTETETRTETAAVPPGTQPGMAGNGLLDETPSALIGETVKDAEGDTVGKIRKVVAANGDAHAVVRSGGFLGLIGGTEILVPLERIEARGDDLVVAGATADQIEQMPEFDSDMHRELPADVTISQSLQAMLR